MGIFLAHLVEVSHPVPDLSGFLLPTYLWAPLPHPCPILNTLSFHFKALAFIVRIS